MQFTETGQKLQITSAVDLIVQISRLKDGTRKITQVTQVVGLGKDGASKLKIKTPDPDKIYLQDIFRFRQTGIGPNGKVLGVFEACNYVPRDITSRLESYGLAVPYEIFQQEKSDEGRN